MITMMITKDDDKGDVCVCDCCGEGDIKYCGGKWFCWSKEIYWTSYKSSFCDDKCV